MVYKFTQPGLIIAMLYVRDPTAFIAIENAIGKLPNGHSIGLSNLQLAVKIKPEEFHAFCAD